MTMTDRKFTPPTTFPAEYVDGLGDRVTISGLSEDGMELIGYYPWHNETDTWQLDGSALEDERFDIHDIPKRGKRVKRYEVRSKGGYVIAVRPDLKTAVIYLRNGRYITLYECDQDGRNPTITRIEDDDL